MGKIILKYSPWIACMLNQQGSEEFISEVEVKDGSTIGDVLATVASHQPEFRKVVFNPDAGVITDQVHVVLNDNVLQYQEASETKLNDGDILYLIPVCYGG